MSTYTFHVSGTHCPSCKILIEDILGEQENVRSVQVDLKKEIVEVEMSSEQNPNELAAFLTDRKSVV